MWYFEKTHHQVTSPGTLVFLINWKISISARSEWLAVQPLHTTWLYCIRVCPMLYMKLELACDWMNLCWCSQVGVCAEVPSWRKVSMAGDIVFAQLANVQEKRSSTLESDLLRQLYVLPHWDKICRSNMLLLPVTLGQPVLVPTSQRPAQDRLATGVPILKSLVILDLEKCQMGATHTHTHTHTCTHTHTHASQAVWLEILLTTSTHSHPFVP